MTIQNDIEKDTLMTLGVERYDSTRAVRAFYVPSSDLSPPATGSDMLKAALVQQRDSHNQNDYGEFVHPSFEDTGSGSSLRVGNLPLQAVRGFKFGDGILGANVYGRTPLSVPRYDAFNSAIETTFHAGTRIIRSFSDDDLELFYWSNSSQDWLRSTPPSTGWSGSFTSIRADYIRNQIRVRTILPNHPLPTILANLGESGATIENLQGTTNSDNFSINGIVRPPGTLRFDAIEVIPFGGGSDVRYALEYTFMEDARKWYDRILYAVGVRCPAVRKGVGPANGFEGVIGHPNCAGASINDTPLTSNIVYVYKEVLVETTFTQCYWGVGGYVCTTHYATHRPIQFGGLFPTHDSPGGYDGANTNKGPGRRWIDVPF